MMNDIPSQKFDATPYFSVLELNIFKTATHISHNDKALSGAKPKTLLQVKDTSF